MKIEITIFSTIFFSKSSNISRIKKEIPLKTIQNDKRTIYHFSPDKFKQKLHYRIYLKSLNYFTSHSYLKLLSSPLTLSLSPFDGTENSKGGVLTVPQLVNLHLDRQFRRHSEGGSYLVIPAKLGNRR